MTVEIGVRYMLLSLHGTVMVRHHKIGLNMESSVRQGRREGCARESVVEAPGKKV